MISTIDWAGPLPQQTPETKPFWDAAGAGTFLLQRCDDCSKFQYPYRGFCCHCWHGSIQDFPSSGEGIIWTHSTVYFNRSAGSTGQPYCVAVVELEGGVRVVSNVVDIEPEDVYIGMPVVVRFAAAGDGQAIPVFVPR